MMFDVVVVGSGFCGTVIARRLAEECDRKVLVLEKREHIAGNMYDEYDSNGIRVQRYGPHNIHTNLDDVYEYICRFGKWNRFELTCEVDIDGIKVPSPFNFKSIDMLYDQHTAEKIKKALTNTYPMKKSMTIVELLKSDNKVVRDYAEMLFEKDYRLYTSKQWGIEPEEIDVSVLNRVPVRLDYTNGYFDDKHQCLPEKGFTELFTAMLDHKNITVETKTDALKRLSVDRTNSRIIFDNAIKDIMVVYTGAADALLHYEHGALPYRSLYFEYKPLETASYQNVPIVSFPKADGYTRITEYTKIPVQECGSKTVIAVEYPLEYNLRAQKGYEPYYPIPNETNLALHKKYTDALDNIENLYLCGRLADYKYYNMDQAIKRAFDVFEKVKEHLQ